MVPFFYLNGYFLKINNIYTINNQLIIILFIYIKLSLELKKYYLELFLRYKLDPGFLRFLLDNI